MLTLNDFGYRHELKATVRVQRKHIDVFGYRHELKVYEVLKHWRILQDRLLGSGGGLVFGYRHELKDIIVSLFVALLFLVIGMS